MSASLSDCLVFKIVKAFHKDGQPRQGRCEQLQQLMAGWSWLVLEADREVLHTAVVCNSMCSDVRTALLCRSVLCSFLSVSACMSRHIYVIGGTTSTHKLELDQRHVSRRRHFQQSNCQQNCHIHLPLVQEELDSVHVQWTSIQCQEHPEYVSVSTDKCLSLIHI